MAGDDRPRTLLATLVAQSDRTHEEHVEDFNRRARGMEESATLSLRQFERWLAGDLAILPRATSRRVAEAHWGHPVQDLLASTSNGTSEPASPTCPDLSAPVTHNGEYGDHEHEHAVARTPRTGHARDQVTAPAVPAWEDLEARQSVEFAARARRAVMDPMILDQLEEDLRRISWEYLHTPRPREHFCELVVLRDQVFRQIENERLRPDQSRDLYGLAGVSCALLAQASHELGFRRAAMSHAHAAFACAELAGHTSLQVWIRATQAAIAEYSGLPRETVRYAEAGRQHASRGTAMIRLMSLAANGHARLGNLAEAEVALSAARQARDDAVDSDPLDDVGGVLTVSLAKQHAYAASAYALLGEGSSAASEATQALRLYQDVPAEQRQPVNEGYAHVDVAFARMLSGELDGVGDALAPVFALPSTARVDLFSDKLRRVHHQLARRPYQGSPVAAELQENIEVFLASLRGEALS